MIDFVKLDIENHRATVTVWRPPINVLNLQYYNEITDVIKVINNNDDIRVAVLKAPEGKFSITGTDLKDFAAFTKDNVFDYADVVSKCFISIYECRVPVIGAIHGPCWGSGLAVAACCDILVASDKSTFAIPEVKVGVVGAASFVSLLVPKKVVNYMALTGLPLDVQEFKQLGALISVVPEEKLTETAMKIAQEIAGSAPQLIQGFKKAIHINTNIDLAQQYATEMNFTGDFMDTADFKEAVQSFLQRRKPQFTGN